MGSGGMGIGAWSMGLGWDIKGYINGMMYDNLYDRKWIKK